MIKLNITKGEYIMARVKMTEKEKQLGQLYKRLKIVLKAYNEGKTYKDYESIIYDLKTD